MFTVMDVVPDSPRLTKNEVDRMNTDGTIFEPTADFEFKTIYPVSQNVLTRCAYDWRHKRA
jgi:hypothetical protein